MFLKFVFRGFDIVDDIFHVLGTIKTFRELNKNRATPRLNVQHKYLLGKGPLAASLNVNEQGKRASRVCYRQTFAFPLTKKERHSEADVEIMLVASAKAQTGE